MMHSAHALSEMGVLYPRCCWLDSAHHRLAYAMKGKNDPRQNDQPSIDAELNALSDVVKGSKAHTMLISSEEFFTAPKSAIEEIAVGLKHHDVEVVAYVRRPDELIESAYNQRLKQIYRDFRRDTNVDYHIDDFLENPELIISDVDYNRHISKWADVFGDRCVKLLQYEMMDAVDSMCGILGVDRSRLIDTSRRENPRASQKLVAMLRLAREVGASVDAQERLRDLAWTKFPYLGGSSLLDSRDRRRILERYSKGNEILFRRLLNCSNPYDPASLLEDEDLVSSDSKLRMVDLMRVIIALIEAPDKKTLS